VGRPIISPSTDWWLVGTVAASFASDIYLETLQNWLWYFNGIRTSRHDHIRWTLTESLH
jgi:hypothetical protein